MVISPDVECLYLRDVESETFERGGEDVEKFAGGGRLVRGTLSGNPR